MISCRFLDKNEVQRLLPQLFSILHEKYERHRADR